MSRRIINRARLEARRMEWPEYIADPDGDRERELQRAYRSRAIWRMAFLYVLALLITLLALYRMGTFQ